VEIGKVWVVGSGSAGQRHYSYACKHFPESEVYCLSKNNAQIFAKNTFDNYLDAKNFCADLIVIANASVDHLFSIESLLSETAHYVIEKPFSSGPVNKEVVKKLSSVVENRVLVAYQLRFSQSLNRMKSELNSGRIGKVLFGTLNVGQYLPDWRVDSDYRTGVSARRELGGGVLNELSHEVDLIFWLFGTPVLLDSQIHKRSKMDLDVEDFVMLSTLQRDQKYSDSWPLSLRLDMIRRDPMRIAEIVGEHGTLKWDGLLGTLSYFDPSFREWELLLKDDSSPHDLLWKNIADFVQVGSHKGASLEDGINVTEFIEKIWRANNFQVEGL
jgi:predicted dehydrogenase